MSLCYASDLDYMAAKHRNALKDWLAENNKYRLATIDDCECLENVLSLRRGSGGAWKPQPDYQPYYVANDFNGDGVSDFAVVVRPMVSEEGSLVLIFLGKSGGGYAVPLVHSVRERSIANLGFFLGRAKEKPVVLLIGVFFSEGEVISIPTTKK